MEHREEGAAAREDADDVVTAALAPLVANGWFALHDRVMPTGATIDHIVVGPGAVIVMDTKAWNGHVTVSNGRLYNSGWNQAKVLAQLTARRDAVAAVLRSAVGLDGPVDMALVITTQPDVGPEIVGGAVVLGIAHLSQAVRTSRTSFSPAQVASISSALLDAFPVAGTAAPVTTGLQQVDGIEVGDLFDRANRFLYLNEWKRHGQHRTYLRDQDGEQFGYKDLLHDSVHLDHTGDAMAQAILAAATNGGVRIDPRDVPRLPVQIRGGRSLPLRGLLCCSAVVGTLAERGDSRRLHGTLIDPTEGVFDLGHADLVTGWVRPASDGPLSRDRGPAERYLELLRERSPFDAAP